MPTNEIDEFGGIAAPRSPIHSSLNDVMTFGKYKGRTIRDVLSIDASYLLWAQRTIEQFKLAEPLVEIAEQYYDKQQAEYNLSYAVSSIGHWDEPFPGTMDWD